MRSVEAPTSHGVPLLPAGGHTSLVFVFGEGRLARWIRWILLAQLVSAVG